VGIAWPLGWGVGQAHATLVRLWSTSGLLERSGLLHLWITGPLQDTSGISPTFCGHPNPWQQFCHEASAALAAVLPCGIRSPGSSFAMRHPHPWQQFCHELSGCTADRSQRIGMVSAHQRCLWAGVRAQAEANMVFMFCGLSVQESVKLLGDWLWRPCYRESVSPYCLCIGQLKWMRWFEVPCLRQGHLRVIAVVATACPAEMNCCEMPW
jgi:hypothetical protein